LCIACLLVSPKPFPAQATTHRHSCRLLPIPAILCGVSTPVLLACFRRGIARTLSRAPIRSSPPLCWLSPSLSFFFSPPPSLLHAPTSPQATTVAGRERKREKEVERERERSIERERETDRQTDTETKRENSGTSTDTFARVTTVTGCVTRHGITKLNYCPAAAPGQKSYSSRRSVFVCCSLRRLPRTRLSRQENTHTGLRGLTKSCARARDNRIYIYIYARWLSPPPPPALPLCAPRKP